MRKRRGCRVLGPCLAALAFVAGACSDDVQEVGPDSGSRGDTETDSGRTTGMADTGTASTTQGSESATGGTDTTSSSTSTPVTVTVSATETTSETSTTDVSSTTGSTGVDTTSGSTGTTSGSTGTTSGSTGTTSGSTTGGECNNDNQCNAFDGACTEGMCIGNVCVAVNLANDTPCDPGNLCLENGACESGVCVGEPVDCSDLDDACEVGVCNPGDGSCETMPANEGGPCDDGNACSYMDVCTGGMCMGTEGALFTDDFVDDSQGWMLEGKWEIGPAMISDAGFFSGLTDPDADHSGGPNDGLAGVLIGGLSGPPPHPYQYMTSPVIDLSVVDPAADPELRFWRWIVSDSDIINERIELWDGADWNVVFQLGNDLYEDSWNQIVIDLSGYTNADFQFRFGHQVHSGGPGMHAEPSWSIDDVSVALSCP